MIADVGLASLRQLLHRPLEPAGSAA
jgi:hypothetical protein